jgi:hypothetical protein
LKKPQSNLARYSEPLTHAEELERNRLLESLWELLEAFVAASQLLRLLTHRTLVDGAPLPGAAGAAMAGMPPWDPAMPKWPPVWSAAARVLGGLFADVTDVPLAPSAYDQAQLFPGAVNNVSGLAYADRLDLPSHAAGSSLKVAMTVAATALPFALWAALFRLWTVKDFTNVVVSERPSWSMQVVFWLREHLDYGDKFVRCKLEMDMEGEQFPKKIKRSFFAYAFVSFLATGAVLLPFLSAMFMLPPLYTPRTDMTNYTELNQSLTIPPTPAPELFAPTPAPTPPPAEANSGLAVMRVSMAMSVLVVYALAALAVGYCSHPLVQYAGYNGSAVKKANGRKVLYRETDRWILAAVVNQPTQWEHFSSLAGRALGAAAAGGALEYFFPDHGAGAAAVCLLAAVLLGCGYQLALRAAKDYFNDWEMFGATTDVLRRIFNAKSRLCLFLLHASLLPVAGCLFMGLLGAQPVDPDSGRPLTDLFGHALGCHRLGFPPQLVRRSVTLTMNQSAYPQRVWHTLPLADFGIFAEAQPVPGGVITFLEIREGWEQALACEGAGGVYLFYWGAFSLGLLALLYPVVLALATRATMASLGLTGADVTIDEGMAVEVLPERKLEKAAEVGQQANESWLPARVLAAYQVEGEPAFDVAASDGRKLEAVKVSTIATAGSGEGAYDS